jgi:hypothetical protein
MLLLLPALLLFGGTEVRGERAGAVDLAGAEVGQAWQRQQHERRRLGPAGAEVAEGWKWRPQERREMAGETVQHVVNSFVVGGHTPGPSRAVAGVPLYVAVLCDL